MSRTSICSIVALELIDYAKKTETEQLEIKDKLESLIQQAVADIAQEDRIVVNTTQGAVIACCGAMEDALEDALLISLTMRDEILKNNAVSFKPIYVQFGINIGSAVLSIKDSAHNVAGSGVEEAQRIMSFANPNQILVSRVYYDMASRVTQEIASMFEHYDMHALDQDVYAVKLHKEQMPAVEQLEIPLPESAPDKWMTFFRKINWTYATISFFLLAGLVYMGKNALHPQEPLITMDEPVDNENVAKATVKEPLPISSETISHSTAASDNQKVGEMTPKEAKVEEPAAIVSPPEVKPAEAKSPDIKAAKAKPVVDKTHAVNHDRKGAASGIESKPEPTAVTSPTSTEATTTETKEPHHNATASAKPAENKSSGDKSTWQSLKDSIKQGTNHKCSQAQMAMNQCN